jgi:hypothetical protein
MPTNFYFQSGNTSGTTSEQRLIEDLIIESLKIYGHDVFYLPRTLVKEDTIFDEDTLSKFTQAYPLEMYLENVEGFGGDGELFSKFGLEVRDSATFILARRRWDELVISSGGTFTQDTRPSEGDLLYFQKTNSLFEIREVEFNNPFYQAGKLYTYRLKCELFEYSSEVIETGITELDANAEEDSLDMLVYQFLLEDNTLFLLEDFSSLILESYLTTNSDAQTDSEDFKNFNNIEDILDFSEVNPFGEII